MASYGNSVVATNVSLQRPMKMNWQTGLSTGTTALGGGALSTYSLEIEEGYVNVNATANQNGIGLQTHAAFEIVFSASSPIATTNNLRIVIPGTTGSSAYKPEISFMRTTTGQIDPATGEDIYVEKVNGQPNTYDVIRVSRTSSPGTGLVGNIQVFIKFTANTDSLLPNA
jgi:hypothetical protein